MSQYFNWDAERIKTEKEHMEQLLYDATHYYDTEF
jgi:hypothetical protein